MSIYATLGEFRVPVWLPAEGAGRFGLVDPAEAPARALHAGVPGHAGRAVRETWVRVWIQGVPAHIDHAGPGWDEWLPPPTPAEVDGVDREEQRTPRAVFFVADWTPKGTARNGQEYVRPLLVLTGEAYVRTPWPDLMERVTDAVEGALRDAPEPGEARPSAGGRA